jgi:hypothetical protein
VFEVSTYAHAKPADPAGAGSGSAAGSAGKGS